MHRETVGLFCLVFLSHAFFIGAPDWNQSARIAGILTFVEPGPNHLTLRIDGFVDSDARNLRTGDWARGADGHLYSNKAPGVSLIGIPAYALIHTAEVIAGAKPASPSFTALNVVALNLWCTVAWTAVAAVVLSLFLTALGFARSDALLGALTYAFGTLVLPYDTSIWGHATAAACLLSALCLAAWPGGPHRPWLAGALGGLAVLVEYVAALGLAAVGCVFLARATGRRPIARFLAGAAPPLLALLGVHKLAFGGFFTTAVQLSNPALLDGSRALGLFGGVDPAAAYGMLFSVWRGLFVYSPILLFAFVGAWQHWKRGEPTLGAACIAAFVACVALVSTVNPWWGGGSRGTRYLIVALPMLAVLAPRRSVLPRRLRVLHAAALALSFSNMLMLAAVGVLADEAERSPLYGVLYRALLSGETFDSVNVGMLLGLGPREGLASFLLVFGSWAVLLLRRARTASPAPLRSGA